MELAVAEAGHDTHVEDVTLAPAPQAVGQALDRHPVPQENGEAAGRPHAGTAALGMLLLLIGLFTHTGGPTSQTRPTTGVGSSQRAT
ncbi:hypothetical protein ACFVJM_32435 [Streptomyces virginiae]|uniref:hypothetical protein n=1 Tax=Streptomyces virginiae TaxID=1961 RepID=UPI0036293A5F